jgi:DNA-binding LacI/PurR family transcriptional regulator
MSTIKDVALLAGVSVATVSRYINKTAKISPDVQKKIEEAINATNYHPNNIARALVHHKTNTIGIVVNNLHDVFFHDLIKGFEIGAEQTHYNIIFCSVYGKDPQGKERYIHYLTNGPTDGIIIYGSYKNDEQLIKDLTDQNFPFILIENEIRGVNTNSLLINNINGAKSAVEYLYSIGHTDIAFIGGDPNKSDLNDRLSGYMSSMIENSLEIKDGYIQHCGNDYHFGYHCMNNLFSLKSMPSAVFCANDSIASFAVRAILDKGLRIPDDISVIGFDNQKILPDDYTGPKITTMDRPLSELAQDSIQLMTDILTTDNRDKVKRYYEAHVLTKETTAALTRPALPKAPGLARS